MFNDCGEIAPRNTVSPDVSSFEMGDCNRQHIPLPLGRRETTPCVRRIWGGMGTPIQIVNVVNRAQPLCMEGCDLPGNGIDFLGYAELRRTTPDVIGRMRSALPFRKALH